MLQSIEKTKLKYLDKSVVWLKSRWLALAAVLLLIGFRVVYWEGWYVTAYCLSIFMLNLFIAFLTPRKDSETDEYILPSTHAGGEYRPFERKLPEFEFWRKSMSAALISLFTTSSRIFDLPVFWPILLLYFIFVFLVTMKHQISDMWEHKYLPWSARKARYAG